MENTTPECTAFEVDIERRQVGALAADAATRLTEHLAQCESCRAFEQVVLLTEAQLARPVPVPAALKLRPGFSSRVTQAERHELIAQALGMLLALVALWVKAGPRVFVAVAPLVAPFALYLWWRKWRLERAMLSLTHQQFVEAVGAQLRHRLALERALFALAPLLLALVFKLLFHRAGNVWVFESQRVALFAAVATAAVAHAIYYLAARWPRLKKQQTQLKAGW